MLFFCLFSTGLYLFIILIFTFVSEKRVKLSLYFIGWGLPLAVILVYVVCRASLAEPEDANTIDRYEQICGKYIHTSLAVFYNLNKFQEDFFFKICDFFLFFFFQLLGHRCICELDLQNSLYRVCMCKFDFLARDCI